MLAGGVGDFMPKTTLEIENLKELKIYLIRTNRTIREFVNEAISEKLQRERMQRQTTLDTGFD